VKHEQVLGGGTSRLEEKEYEILVRCEDRAGNIAERTAKFNVEVDENIPSITRIYSQAGSLFIVTNEPAECSYLNEPLAGRNNACEFSVKEGEGNAMQIESGSNGQTHKTGFESGKKYHIKCKDVNNLEPSTCNEIVEKGF
jgi:hypothetical protein